MMTGFGCLFLRYEKLGILCIILGFTAYILNLMWIFI